MTQKCVLHRDEKTTVIQHYMFRFVTAVR